MKEGASKKPASRTRWPRISNGLIWLMFCALAGTGLLLRWRLPPGSRGGRGLTALGWDRHEWGDLHSWVGYGFLLMLVVHLLMHWRWFWQIAARKRSWPLVMGLGGGVVIIAALVLLPVRDRIGQDDHRGGPRQHREGQMREMDHEERDE
ncbi:DUF4405 domain-containing protein [Haloferula sp.]|uniref:DUF4405 domain-containing protein n=1 Tax=Haloferula sp. TaxID=2497595 RepID=UPI003C714ED6